MKRFLLWIISVALGVVVLVAGILEHLWGENIVDLIARLL